MSSKLLPAVRLMAAPTLMLAVFAGTLNLPRAAADQKKPVKRKPNASGGKSIAAVTVGKKVYDTQGCATCHAIAGKGGSAGPDLSQTGSDPRHTLQWLADQVSDPKKHTPTSTMPGFAKSIRGTDLTTLSLYLASLKTSSAPAAPAATHTAAPNPAVTAKIESMGGRVEPLAENDNHLDVSFPMAGAAVTDTSLAALTQLKNVVHLDLGKTAVTDAGIAHIKGLTGLTELHLENTKITDAGLADLTGMRDLNYLNLYGDNITDAGLEHLRGLSNLRHLFLWQTKVTDEGVNKLKKALPQLEIVRGWDEAPKK